MDYLDRSCKLAKREKDFSFLDFNQEDVIYLSSPEQLDGVSCGIHMLMNIERLLKHLPTMNEVSQEKLEAVLKDTKENAHTKMLNKRKEMAQTVKSWTLIEVESDAPVDSEVL